VFAVSLIMVKWMAIHAHLCLLLAYFSLLCRERIFRLEFDVPGHGGIPPAVHAAVSEIVFDDRSPEVEMDLGK
jgi:hypothetical protein